MVSTQFEKLEEKIHLALEVIENLKNQKQTLKDELSNAEIKIEDLNLTIGQKDAELNQIQGEMSEKTSNINQASEKIQGLISKLEQENLEAILL